MCLMDWRLGRLVRFNSLTGSNPTSVMQLPVNMQRVGIVVSIASADTIGDDQIQVLNEQGQLVVCKDVALLPLLMSVTEYGDLVTKALKIGSLDGGNYVVIGEWTMPEQYLAAALEDFMNRSKYP